MENRIIEVDIQGENFNKPGKLEVIHEPPYLRFVWEKGVEVALRTDGLLWDYSDLSVGETLENGEFRTAQYCRFDIRNPEARFSIRVFHDERLVLSDFIALATEKSYSRDLDLALAPQV